MSRPFRAILLVSVVVLAGCSFTLDTGTPGSPTPDVQPKTPSATPTPNESSRFPPGADETGFENVTALLEAHTAVLNSTGYVANGTGNTTILRSGFLVEVTRDLRVVAVNGSRQYYETRQTHAGPVDRYVQRYSNGSVEFRRLEENGEVTVRRRERQSAEELARVDHLDSFLRGGNFSVNEVNETADPTTVLLRANASDNETALLSGLPKDAERIRSYEAIVLVDSAGRVRRLNATANFVINGQNRTHAVSFELVRIGVRNVSRPDWVDGATGSDGRSGDRTGPAGRRVRPAGDAGAPTVGTPPESPPPVRTRPRVGTASSRPPWSASPDRRPHWRRFVVSTSG